MKTNLMIILLMVLFPSCAFSGEIYGCIKKGKKFIDKGVRVEITSEDKTYPPTETYTDDYGTYSLCVPDKGRLILKVNYEGQLTPGFVVYSYENSVQYNFSLEEKDGQYSLRRE